MATKVVVCPQCGAAAAPARYACAACGALLASVGAAVPRRWLDHDRGASVASGHAEARPLSAAVSTAVPIPIWPPVGDPGPAPLPPERIPAGAYLAPSAILPPQDAVGPARNGGAAHAGLKGDAVTTAEPPSQASIAETLDAFGISNDTAHRLIGGGASIAALGFLLPWTNIVSSGGLLGDYLSRWGLAGPAHWIVAAVLVAMVVIALAGNWARRIPVGPLAIASAALLVGLVWPQLFGSAGPSAGVWLVVAGAIVLASGGVLDLRRHDRDTPGV